MEWCRSAHATDVFKQKYKISVLFFFFSGCAPSRNEHDNLNHNSSFKCVPRLIIWSLLQLPQRDMRPLVIRASKCSRRWWPQTYILKPNQSDTRWSAENEVKTYRNRKCRGEAAVQASAGETEISSVAAALLFCWWLWVANSSRIFSRCLVHNASHGHDAPRASTRSLTLDLVMKERRGLKVGEMGKEEERREWKRTAEL